MSSPPSTPTTCACRQPFALSQAGNDRPGGEGCDAPRRVELADWEEEDGRIFVTVTSAKPIDERIIRYLDRSGIFEDAKVEEKSADGLKLIMSADVEQKYFYFGTDNIGRDLLTRTLIAGRVSLAIGLLAGLVAVVIGVLYGATAGFMGGKTDEVMMRIVDILYSLPFIFFVIMLVVFFGRNFVLMFLAVGAVLWLDMARIVRGQALSIKRQEYVQAAEALGVTRAGILLRHVVPNLWARRHLHDVARAPGDHPRKLPVVSRPRRAGADVELGRSDFAGAKNIPGANWLLFFPSFFLTTTLFALNFIGDGLRDALDPKDR